MDYVNCRLCPRECCADRTAGETGFCRCPGTALVAKTMLHKWEEPALAGNGGSGAIFFGGCTLGCKYCQNRVISCGAVGQAVDSAQLRAMMEQLIAGGAENIDLVTPTHFLPTILPALEPKLPVPVVYNCGGYERVQTLREICRCPAGPAAFRCGGLFSQGYSCHPGDGAADRPCDLGRGQGGAGHHHPPSDPAGLCGQFPAGFGLDRG